MLENMTEAQAREQILQEVPAYCDTFHSKRNTKQETEPPCILCI